jgi:undecaprenyl-diphosphatase
MLEHLKSFDTKLFLYLNGKHNSFFDPIMYWLSNTVIWIPLYLLLAILIIRHYKKQSILIFIILIALMTVSDQLSGNIIRDYVMRPRPSHEAALQGLIHLSKAGSGGQYGFVSAHASNCFALASFIIFILPINFRWLKYLLLIWALLVSYSRVYNGVHYPGDILCGAIIGILLAYFFASLYFLIDKKMTRFNKGHT